VRKLRHSASFLRLQKSQQVDELRAAEALIQALGHQRDIRGLDGNNLLSRNANFGVRPSNQRHCVGGIFASYARERFGFRLDIVDFKTRGEARAREDDSFENIVPGADGADSGEIWPDMAALIADGVAAVAGHFLAEENVAAAADIAA